MGKIRVGVNGFGRIGRLATRFVFANGEDCPYEIVHINEPYTTAEGSAYLMEFDSTHGRFQESVEAKDENTIIVGGKRQVTYSRFETPGEVPWDQYKVDVVMECSGVFKKVEKLEPYFAKGVKRVVVSAPVDGVPNIVIGCNDELITADEKIVTAASCTTNCIGPVIGAIDKNFGITRGMINTCHNITNTQSALDKANVSKPSDLRRARSSVSNLSPTSTGSAKAITKVYPHLQGKLDGVAIRVPLLNASITDLTLSVEKDVTKEEVNKALQDAADGKILGFETKPLVSTDYCNDTRSGIVDAQSTIVVDKKMIKLLVWYDSEYGYSKRMDDVLARVCSFLQ